MTDGNKDNSGASIEQTIWLKQALITVTVLPLAGDILFLSL